MAEKCIVEVYDDAMAQYEYKGVKLSYKHKKISSGNYVRKNSYCNNIIEFAIKKPSAFSMTQ